MPSRGEVLFEDLKRMLDDCAPGHQIRPGKHRDTVLFGGKTFPGLPKGAHSSRGSRHGRAKIQIGHVRSLVRHLGINQDCARGVIPGL
jgi:hypothetical protein